MHQMIMKNTDLNLIIDHFDGNGLNNQRENLRLATRMQQGANRYKIEGIRNPSSSYKGVSQRSNGSWRARIRVNGELIDLGTFNSEVSAAKEYNRAALKYFGGFAVLNAIPPDS
jgi:hypothetical protein